ncbi:MAG: hypothetical protein CVV21_09000 [Candidatus Goldiibacteriota bacterium HGW-Goldbacteria-1]|jgi:outer membrane protein assembly factor BamA|nr:MAG: hypothetical protein CVV21_09000 [Candidatus Goldiibacteriota bacterium HGW-Goldbacteria-1]
MKKILIIAVMIITASFVFAADDAKKYEDSWLILPLPLYSEETGLKGIITGAYFYNKKPDTFSSNIQLYLSYSLKNQVSVEEEGWHYWENNEYKLYHNSYYKKYPDTFFGVGNDNKDDAAEKVTFQMLKFRAEFHKKIAGLLYAGVRLSYENFVLLEAKPNGLISSEVFKGSRGGSYFGQGLVFSMDTRDNSLLAMDGIYTTLYCDYYGLGLNVRDSFVKTEFDFRKYFKLADNQSIAAEVFTGVIAGSPPIQLMEQFGGDHKMRGYFYGRYRDKCMSFVQAEYRIIPWERVGFTVFAGAGDVYESSPADMNVKFAGGVGLRIGLVPEERANLRIDLGYGRDGLAFIFYAFEAF